MILHCNGSGAGGLQEVLGINATGKGGGKRLIVDKKALVDLGSINMLVWEPPLPDICLCSYGGLNDSETYDLGGNRVW